MKYRIVYIQRKQISNGKIEIEKFYIIEALKRILFFFESWKPLSYTVNPHSCRSFKFPTEPEAESFLKTYCMENKREIVSTLNYVVKEEEK